jgi:hypothetical protein
MSVCSHTVMRELDPRIPKHGADLSRLPDKPGNDAARHA